jgi:hypothetical protein
MPDAETPAPTPHPDCHACPAWRQMQQLQAKIQEREAVAAEKNELIRLCAKTLQEIAPSPASPPTKP